MGVVNRTETALARNETKPCTPVSYMNPWSTVIAMLLVYVIALLWFCRHGKKICLPPPDSVYPYKRRLKELKIALDRFLIDDIFLELSDHKLGEGAVGFVFKGFVYPKTQTRFKQKTCAAVKMSYPMPHKSIGLLEEAARMAKLDHAHIVKLMAVSKLSFSAFRPMFAMEWLPGGSLSEFFNEEIRSKADEESRLRVRVTDMLHVLLQVGEALRYLHEHRDMNGNDFTHRDVAARNVLLTDRNLAQSTAKLGDFGLPIDFGNRLPIPYLPPEIVNARDHSPKHRPESDVWMFGVLCWECATLGAEPHYQRTIGEIRDCFRATDRGLHRPPACPDEFWVFMLSCLSIEQHERPRFSGPADSPFCALKMMTDMRKRYESGDRCFRMVANTSKCTCWKHRCRKPIPSVALKP